MKHLMLFSTLLLLVGCTSKAVPEPVTLGMVQPLTGSDRDRGQEVRQAVQLAVSELRTAEIRVGTRDFLVLHADGGGDARTTRAETVRLVAVNRTPALIGVLSPALGEVFFREARLLGVPAVLAGELAAPPTVDGQLTLGVGPRERGRGLAALVRETVKLSFVAVLIDERDPHAIALATAFAQPMRESPALPCEEYRFAGPETRSVVLKRLAEKKPAAVLLAVPAADHDAIRSELQQLGITPIWLDGGPDRDLPGPPTDSGTIYRITVYNGADLSSTGKAFAQAYQERFGTSPSLSAVLSWEAVQLIARQMSQASSASNLRLREIFAQADLNFEGITGTVKFRDRQAVRKLFILRDQDGKRTTEKAISPGE